MARLTLNGTVHLEPPSDARKLEGECCCYRSLKMESLLIVLIAFLDAYRLLIALITWHVRAIFGMLIRAKGEFWLVSV